MFEFKSNILLFVLCLFPLVFVSFFASSFGAIVTFLSIVLICLFCFLLYLESCHTPCPHVCKMRKQKQVSLQQSVPLPRVHKHSTTYMGPQNRQEGGWIWRENRMREAKERNMQNVAFGGCFTKCRGLGLALQGRTRMREKDGIFFFFQAHHRGTKAQVIYLAVPLGHTKLSSQPLKTDSLLILKKLYFPHQHVLIFMRRFYSVLEWYF